MKRLGIKINSFSTIEKQEEALALLRDYPHTAEELAEELELSLDNTRTILKRLEEQKIIWCTQRRYQIKGGYGA